MRQTGAVPSQILCDLIANGGVASRSPIPEPNIQPASLDLRLGERGYRVRAAFLPRAGETIEDALQNYREETLDLSQGAVLQKNHTYVLELQESLNLPEQVHAYTNNKSSTGRINVWVRTLVDRLARFDKIPYGYSGKLYVMVTPRSWSVRVASGLALNQARFLVGDNRLTDLELDMTHQRIGLIYDHQGQKLPAELDKGVLLSADLSGEVAGYVARHNDQTLDLASGQKHRAEDFWKPITAQRGEVCLRQGDFYIMVTREFLRVPPAFAVEMVAYDIQSGEYRSHYAGFFDPGFGFGDEGQILGTPAVLEVDPHEDVIMRHGQPICKMVYEHMVKPPDRLYGSDLSSNYQNQRGPQLGKQFTRYVHEPSAS
jgi:dCTP deaminase